MSNSQELSAVIITLNEASRVLKCLESVSFCNEIIVVDSGSTDGTQQICADFGAKVVKQDWLGYGQQKVFAVKQARNDWVLCLDADETIDEQLAHNILEFMKNPAAKACTMARCNRFMGRWLRFGEGYPDISLRLFHRKHAHWSHDPVHEKVIYQDEVHHLAGDILHCSEESIGQYLAKQNHYTDLQANLLHQRGKKISTGKLILSPLIRFVKFYLVKQGFRDGIPGLIHISIGCFNSFIKYAKTIAKQ